MGLSKPIFILGEAMGANEERIGRGFVGASGVELLRMLAEAGVMELTDDDRRSISKFYTTGNPVNIDNIWQRHPEFFRSNVFQFHPPQNDLATLTTDKLLAIPGYPKLGATGWIDRKYSHELERLGDEIISCDPNLIVVLGNTPLWAMAGRTGISKLRGTTCLSTHTVSGYKLLAAYHPAAVIRQWELRPTTIIDLGKINHEKDFPEVRRPNCEIWIEPSIEDIWRWLQSYLNRQGILAVDIETSGTRITCIGFAAGRDRAIVIPFDDERTASRSYWPTVDDEVAAWKIIRGILEDGSVKKVFQNGLYDIAFLFRSYGIRTLGATQDTMLLHHALQPEALKGLGFLGSVYTNHGPWKSERKHTETIKRDE